jgi:hypothetical protein
MKGRPGAVPEECGFIHGGLSQLQHNVLQKTAQRSLNEGEKAFLKNKNYPTFLSPIFCSVLVCL